MPELAVGDLRKRAERRAIAAPPLLQQDRHSGGDFPPALGSQYTKRFHTRVGVLLRFPALSSGGVMQTITNQSTFNATQAISTPMAAALPQDAVAGSRRVQG